MGGLKIIDVKVVGLCSKCRKEGDEIPKRKDGSLVSDKDIMCLQGAFGNCETINEKEMKYYIYLCPQCKNQVEPKFMGCKCEKCGNWLYEYLSKTEVFVKEGDKE